MKKMLSVLAVAGLLAPSAQTVAMQRMRSTGAAAKARAQKAGEAASEKLSEWTGSLMYQVGRAIGRQRYDQLATIIKKHEKRAKGIAGAAAVLAVVVGIIRFFPRGQKEDDSVGVALPTGPSPFGIKTHNPALEESQEAHRQRLAQRRSQEFARRQREYQAGQTGGTGGVAMQEGRDGSGEDDGAEAGFAGTAAAAAGAVQAGFQQAGKWLQQLAPEVPPADSGDSSAPVYDPTTGEQL